MKTIVWAFLFIFSLAMCSCNSKQTNKDNEEVSIDTLIVENETIESYYKPDIDLFYLYSTDNANTAFVSLSDVYPLSEHVDSSVIPDLTEMEYEDGQYFKLDSEYRNRFLSKTGISETDFVYVYDYVTNNLVSFTVKSLNVVAKINDYADSSDWPFSQYDYMIGFEIDKKNLNGFRDIFYDVLVYVGKENPFAKKQLIPIVWNKIANQEYPSKPIKDEDKIYLNNLAIGNTHIFETDGMQYFLQDYLDEYNQVYCRRLLVVEAKTKDVIIEKIFGVGEGTSPSPLNYEYDDINQWTGKLLKDKAAVVFGFEYISFGCPYISVLDKSNEDIYINCDNRH